MYLKTLNKQTIAIAMYGKSPKNNKQLKTTAWFHLLTLWLFLSCEWPGYVKEILVYDRDGDFLCALYADGVNQEFLPTESSSFTLVSPKQNLPVVVHEAESAGAPLL